MRQGVGCHALDRRERGWILNWPARRIRLGRTSNQTSAAFSWRQLCGVQFGRGSRSTDRSRVSLPKNVVVRKPRIKRCRAGSRLNSPDHPIRTLFRPCPMIVWDSVRENLEAAEEMGCGYTISPLNTTIPQIVALESLSKIRPGQSGLGALRYLRSPST